MMKRLEIDGRIVTVYPKRIEINGEEVVTQGEVLIELQPEVWATDQMETASNSPPEGALAAALQPVVEESQPG